MSQSENRKIIDTEHAKGNKVVLFAGAHGIANALDTLLDAGKLLKDISVTICLMGGGQEKERLKLRAQQEKITNVIFLERVNKNEVDGILELADILYIGLAKTDLFRFGISPNKMFDYMLAARPIISAIDAGNDMVKDADCGISVSAEDPEAVANAIKELLAMDDLERLRLGENGKAYVLANHNYEKLAADFVAALEN